MGILKKSNKESAEAALGKEIMKVLPINPRPWYKTRHLTQLNLLLLVPLFASATIGFDGAMMNGLQTLPQWRAYFSHPESAILGAINAVYPIGKLIGLFPSTWLSDRYGRKRPMFVGFILLFIGTVVQGASQNIAMLIISRFLLGFGTAFLAQPSPILITELAYPTQRGKITSLYNTFYYFGAVLAAWSTYGTFRLHSTWSWRIPSIMQGAFPVIQFCFFFFIPESPRWLVAKGRVEEGRSILVKYHAGGDEASSLVDYEIREMEDNIRLEQLINSQSSYLDLIRTPANRRRTFVAAILGFYTQWSGNSVISYYLTLVLNTIGITSVSSQALINGLLQIFNWFAAVVAGAMMVDRIGRRKLFLISTGGMLASYIIWTVLSSVFTTTLNQRVGNTVVVFIFIYYFFYDIAFTPLMPAYVVEIYQYTLRGRGVTAAYTVNYLALILGNFVNPLAMKAIGWHYYIVFCVLLTISFTLIWFFFPETKGHTLEEIAEIFDRPIGNGAEVDHVGNDQEKVGSHIEVPKRES
ncbi:general substrate transporter [Lipomyces doorenjongii]